MSDNISEQLTLDKLPLKKGAYIKEVFCEDKSLRKHILDMGLTPNTEVVLLKTAPFGDPLEFRVRGYVLTLRKADASKIIIRDIHEPKKVVPNKITFSEVQHSQKGEKQIYELNKIKMPQAKTDVKLALIGNQNCGKTTLFNRLTGSHQHVGNFPGVTVDRVDGEVLNKPGVTITDLPGIYSLSPYNHEEILTRNFLLQDKPDGIINIVDATNIERNLLLTMQLIELDIPMVIALNMIDEVRENGGSIDINGLEHELGVPVVPVSALKNEGIDELLDHIVNVARFEEKPNKNDFCSSEGAGSAVHRAIHSMQHLIEDHALRCKLPLRFAATKLAEGDLLVLNMLALDKNEADTFKQIVSQMEAETGLDSQAALTDMRFEFIDSLCSRCVVRQGESEGYLLSARADKILTGKYTAFPAFLIIIAFIFYMTFGPFGAWLSEILSGWIETFTAFVDNGLTAYGLNPTIHSLIIGGVFAGVGSVLSFLPIIVVLFFFLSLLEDSGYMARVAFVMDKLLRKIGLSGRSFVPMLIGFGCSVPAIMSARTMPSERDRKMTIMLVPFMSCSAKLPIYTLFTAAFFVEKQWLVIVALYLIGVIVGITFAFLLKIFFFKGNPVPFVMELPNYRMPSFQNVVRLIYNKAKGFVTKAFTIIFFAAIIIWFLQSFDSRLYLVSDSSQSLLAHLGSFITPIFEPLGISDWRISTAFITGFMAKESVISTLSVLSGGTSQLPALFSNTTAFVFLIFCLLYTPCVAAIATVKRELGKRYAVGIVLLQCSIAWFVAFLVYRLILIV
ncbi:ferrous iron transport protein B [bacterium]|nr:ferrous iron transport protein B [bacterium]